MTEKSAATFTGPPRACLRGSERDANEIVLWGPGATVQSVKCTGTECKWMLSTHIKMLGVEGHR